MKLSDPAALHHGEADIEARAGVRSASALIAERSALAAEVAPLRARFGMNGTYNDQRKIQLALAQLRVREHLAATSGKATEAAFDAMARTDKAYMAWCNENELARAEWVVLEDRIDAIDDALLRSNALLRFASNELMITPSGGGA